MSKKNFIRAAALAAALVMVFSVFAGCAAKKTDPEPTEAPTHAPTEAPADPSAMIVGKWSTEINIGEAVNEALKDDESGMFSGLELSDTFFDLTITFGEDGSYVLEPELDSYKAAMKQVTDQIVPVIRDFVIAMYTAFAEEGAEPTEEEILADMEIGSWDELGEQMIEGIEQSSDEMRAGGSYELNGETLRLSDGEDPDTQEITVALTEAELTFTAISGTDEDSIITAQMLPMVFTRAD